MALNIDTRKQYLALDSSKNRECFAKITSLDKNERPLETIEGKITQGSINVDGKSSLRRTFSLTMVAQDVRITDVFWGLTTKVKLEMSFRDLTHPTNDNLTWFKQGIYLLTDFKVQKSLNNFTINLSGKDKMCLLNGECGGNFTAITDIGQFQQEDENGEISLTQIKIADIIPEMLIGIGGEMPYNIILNNVEDYGLELLSLNDASGIYVIFDVKGLETTLYYLGNDPSACDNVFLDKEHTIPIQENFRRIDLDYKEEDEDPSITRYKIARLAKINAYEDLQDFPDGETLTVWLRGDNKKKLVFKADNGDIVGYRITGLTYPGELIANVGDTITSILDKITNQFNTFEYFYDVDGRFVFQLKQTYVNRSYTSQTDFTNKDTISYVESPYVMPKYSYYFNNNILLTTINNAPNLNNIKNDFVIWGENSNNNAIHLRCAIDNKPIKYVNYEGIEYNSNEQDWRELIYQMACDWFQHYHDDDYVYQIQKNNPHDEYLRLYGKTGYEQYYTDMQAFWRLLYNPNPGEKEKELFNAETHWARAVEDDPDTLPFWIDFIDSEESKIGQYSIKNIGDRTKVVNNSNIKMIYPKNIPNIIYKLQTEDSSDDDQEQIQFKEDGHFVLWVNDMSSFNIAALPKSCYDEFDSLFYKHTYFTDTISLTSVPIYYLEPNTLIQVKDEDSGIAGEYIIDRLTIPLAYNGTMSITANKLPNRIY